jgi:hypothetical protein
MHSAQLFLDDGANPIEPQVSPFALAWAVLKGTQERSAPQYGRRMAANTGREKGNMATITRHRAPRARP